MYIHIPKEKRTKFDPFRRKGIFVGYNDTSKAYQICFLGLNKIEINIYLTFDEDLAYSKSRRIPIEEVKESKGKRVKGTKIVEAIPEDHEHHDMEEPQEHVEPLHEKESHKRKLTWALDLIQEVGRYGAP